MSGWTEVNDIRKKLMREWERGILLAARLNKEPLAPRRIPLKKPASRDWVDRYDAAKQWAAELTSAEKKNLFEVELQEIVHRQLGRNRFPQAVNFPTDEALFRFLGKWEIVQRFDRLSQQILSSFPELRGWLEKRALTALANTDNWPRLLAVLSFLKKTPRPGIYLRQLVLPGVDTKFTERHKKLLSELLDLVLPEGAVNWGATGVKKFEQRYGFTSKPIQIRFRILDREHYVSGISDLQISVADFKNLQPDIDTVFITENEINGLAFPDVKGAIILFGLGFGLDRLADIGWLKSKTIYYWGDIDTHGFVMLDQLRSYFPQVASFLMDKKTLMSHRQQWGEETAPANRDLERLSKEEKDVYDILVNNSLSKKLRLEQEQISFDIVKSVLEKKVLLFKDSQGDVSTLET